MGQVIRLGNAIEHLAELDQEATIYAAAPWTSDSAAIIAHQTESGDPPYDAEELGLTYFLEVFLALEFLEGWEPSLKRPVSTQERCERLIRFAVDDA